jgi:hypothetical protein
LQSVVRQNNLTKLLKSVRRWGDPKLCSNSLRLSNTTSAPSLSVYCASISYRSLRVHRSHNCVSFVLACMTSREPLAYSHVIYVPTLYYQKRGFLTYVSNVCCLCSDSSERIRDILLVACFRARVL